MDMQQLTKIILAWELFEDQMPQVHIASKLGVNRDTVRLWINAIKELGLLEYLGDYSNAKKDLINWGKFWLLGLSSLIFKRIPD